MASFIEPHLRTFPLHLLLGDFNALVNHQLDSNNVTAPNSWPRLTNSIHKEPPLLIDSFRNRNPHTGSFSRYPSPLHPNETRIDLILLSPSLFQRLPLLDASISTSNTYSDHHPVIVHLSSPPIPPSSPTPAPLTAYRKLTKDESASFHRSLNDLDAWIPNALNSFDTFSSEDIISITDRIMDEVTKAYHHITKTHPHKPTSSEKAFHKLLHSNPPPPPWKSRSVLPLR